MIMTTAPGSNPDAVLPWGGRLRLADRHRGEALVSLLGMAVLVLGFVMRANPLLIVLAAALVTGMAAAWTPGADAATMLHAATHTLATFGKAFNANRYVSVVWMVLAAIGMLERLGLQERAR